MACLSRTALGLCLAVALLSCPVAPLPAQSKCTVVVDPADPASPSLHDAAVLVRTAVAAHAHRAAAALASGPLGPVATVCLRKGVHSLHGRPLSLTAEHSLPRSTDTAPTPLHTHPSVVWRGDPGAVVSGGVQVTGWQPVPGAGVAANTYKAPLPGAVAAEITLRQLWVNGERQRRTIQPSPASLGLEPTATGYTAKVAPGWKLPATVEFQWPSQIRNWINPRCPLSNATAGTSIVVDPHCWAFLIARNSGKAPAAPSLIENVGLPQASGEFFADTDSIYFAAPAGVDMTKAEVWAPAQETLLNGTGVHGHTWTGVTFSYSTWLGPNRPGGYVPTQSGVHACVLPNTVTSFREGVAATGSCEPLGAVQIDASSGLTFSNCSFNRHGAQYALSIGKASQGIVVDDCDFFDLSGGSVKLGNVNDSRATSSAPADWDSTMAVTRSASNYSSLEYWGCANIFAGYVRNTTIAHNTITDAGYSGVSCGWGWGSVVSFAANNEIAFNRIQGCMKLLVDGGGIYTLGPQPNSTVRGNYVSGDENRFAVLYHDNGSRYFTTTHNVVESSPEAWAFFLQGCCGKPALDIHVDHCWYRSTLAPTNNCAKEGCTVDTATVYHVADGAPWPSDAQAIVNAAGRPGPGRL